MASNKVQIWNLALGGICTKRIASENEDTIEARACKNCYPDILDEVLGAHPWTFAQKRIILALLDKTPVDIGDGMIYVYSRPSDLIKATYKSDSLATIKLEEDGILSDTTPLSIIYTFRNDKPSAYFPLFTRALATRLAAEICFPITSSVQKAEALHKKYIDIDLPNAMSGDSQQGTPQEINQDEWENARQVGGLTARAGYQTWYPV